MTAIIFLVIESIVFNDQNSSFLFRGNSPSTEFQGELHLVQDQRIQLTLIFLPWDFCNQSLATNYPSNPHPFDGGKAEKMLVLEVAVCLVIKQDSHP